MTRMIVNISTGKIKTTFLIIIFTLSITACVSGPDEKQPETIEAANKFLSLGVSHYNNNNQELAISYFNNALHKFRSIDHQYGIASSCLNLSKSHLNLGNIDTAEAFLKQARYLIKQEGISQLSSNLAIIESSIAIENKEHAQAREILQPLLERNNKFSLAAIQNRARIAFAEATDKNNNDAIQWTEKFKQQLGESEHNPSYNARLARFQAALSSEIKTQEKYYLSALDIYRQQTNRVGIAATLQEWANALIRVGQHESAEDKLLRALYIRQSLRDKKNSLKALASLAKISDDDKAPLWAERLKNKDFNQWDEFVSDFNIFPE